MSLTGYQLGRYRLQQILGTGGMGEVYLATDTLINRQVAIKLIRSEVSSYPHSNVSQESDRLFQREMKAIATLDHPHILPLFDYGEETVDGNRLAYLVMPYRPEGSLANWLQQHTATGVLTPQEVVFFVQQAADALQHAHDHQIIHQDVKPANFLIRRNAADPDHPDLLLTDFGVSKFTTATANLSQSVRGTPAAMAPEQWQGHPVYGTDQYALAIMAYEMLTGRPPFQGGLSQLMYQHVYVTPPPPSAFNPRLNSDIDAVFLHALSKKPEDRFASVSAFARAFTQAALGNAPRQVEPSFPQSAPDDIPPPPPGFEPPWKPAESLGNERPVTPPNFSSGQQVMTPGLSAQTPVFPPGTGGGRNAPPREQPVQPARFSAQAPVAPPPIGGGMSSPPKTPRWRGIILAVLALVVILGAGGIFALLHFRNQPAPTGTHTASGKGTLTTNDSTQTAEAKIIATQAALDGSQQTATATAYQTFYTNITNGTPALNDPLSDNSHGYGWNTASNSNGGCQFTGGVYQVSETNSSYINTCAAVNTNYSNFAFLADEKVTQGACGGLLFRSDSSVANFYYWQVCQDGSYEINLYKNNSFVSTLSNSTSSSIYTGLNQTNLLAVVAQGQTLDFYVNNQFLDSVTDGTFSHGVIGFVVNQNQVSGPTVVDYSNLKVWKI